MRSYFYRKSAILVWAFLHFSFILSAQFSDNTIIVTGAPQTYTGSPCTTTLVVALDGGATLTEGVDYTYIIGNCADNVNAGTASATVTVTGINSYSGTEDFAITFTIAPKPIQVEELKADNKVYDGTTAATLTFDETAFKNKLYIDDRTGITVHYPETGDFDRTSRGDAISVSASGDVTLSGGKWENYVVLQQSGLTATITPKSIKDATISIQAIPVQTYTGSTITPSLTVDDAARGVALAVGTDYDIVDYLYNIDVGSATVVITGRINYSNVDTREASFTIVRKPITVEELTAQNKVFDGTTEAPLIFDTDAFKTKLAPEDWDVITITPPATGTFAQSDVGAGLAVTAADVELGGAKAANYDVTQQTGLTATITQKALDASDLAIAPVPSYTYTGLPIAPLLTVTEGANTLRPVQDYTVDYANNIDAGTASATATITGTGNYSGNATAATTFLIEPRDINEATVVSTQNQTYTGATLTTTVIITDGASTLVENTDYTLSSYSNNTDAGLATVTITGINNYTATRQSTFTIEQKVLIDSDLTIAPVPSYTYTGVAIEPLLTVTEGANTLRPLLDYTVSYDNNVNAGIASATATVTITNSGNYTGSASTATTFTIDPMTIPVAELAAQDKTFDGTTAATLTFDEDAFKAKLVAADRDGITVDYPTTGSFAQAEVDKNITVTPSAEVTLSEGNAGNYTLTPQTGLKADINPKAITSGDVSVAPVSPQTYTGLSITPELTIYDGSTLLIKNSDYTVTYRENVDVGSATATIRGTGNYSNVDTRSASFTIVQKPIQVEELTAQNKPFDGSAAATITFNEATFKSKLAPEDRDVITITAPATGTFAQSDVGTGIAVTAADVELGGAKAANYAVTQQPGLTADITRKPLIASDLTIAPVPSYTYTGVAIEPLLTVTEGANTLRPVQDYTVDYANNIDAGTASATATITGTGNYSGNAATTTTFAISRKPIQVTELKAQDKPFDGSAAATITFNEDAFKTKLAVVDWSAVTITAPGTGTFAQSGVGSNLPVTAASSVSLSGAKAANYAVTQQSGLTATITQKVIDASDLAIAPVPSYTYTGVAIAPPLTVTDGINTLRPGLDYTVSYANNINAGMASATVTTTGTGNYSGGASTTTTFTIAPKDINEAIVAAVPSYTYTGAAITPALTITDGAYTLVENTDYTLAYDDNINVGQATVTVTGINNYTATRQTAFNIIQKSITDADITIAPIPPQIYTGAALTPPVVAVYGAGTLTEDTDYTTAYTNNINVGTATVTVTGMANYDGAINVSFEIVKANQTINFPDIPPLVLTGGSYSLQATAASGLPVTYTSSNPAVADIGSDGVTLLLKAAGAAIVTASQPGNNNYNPAPSVQRQVTVIESGNVGVRNVTVIGAQYDGANSRYVMNCNENSVTVIVEPEDHTARVYYGETEGNVFHPEIPTGVRTVTYTVASGTCTQDYTLEIARPFKFEDVVKMRWNNTLTVIKTPANNGGFHFTSCTWYGNGRLIVADWSFSAGNTGQTLDPTVSYHAVLAADEYTGTLNTCPSLVVLQPAATAMVAYPNPARSNSFVSVEINLDEAQLDHAEIEIFNVVGASMGRVRVAGRITPLNLSALPTGMYLLNLRGKNGLNETVKVVVQ